MRKSIALLLLVAGILTTVLASSCDQHGTTASPAGTAAASLSGPAQVQLSPTQSSSPAVAGFEFVETVYDNGVISISYPQVVRLVDTEKQDKLNKLIANTALRDVDMLKSESDLAEYEVTYKVTYNTPEIISMYFSGYGNYSGAAHPYQFIYSTTINVNQLDIVPLSSLIKIDEKIIKLLKGGKLSSMSYDMTADYEKGIRDYLKDMESESEFWLGELRNADTQDHSIVSYLTPDALVISVQVPHVMGDHVEILLPYATLDGVKTDNELWKSIQA